MITVVGATGTLGRQLIPQLLSPDGVPGGEPVRAVAHDPEPLRAQPGLELVAADVATEAGAARAVAGARVVVSAITGFAAPAGVMGVDAAANRTLIGAAARAGVEHVVILSVRGADVGSPIELFRAKGQAEQAARESGMNWTLIRPTAYLETWLGIVGAPLVATGKTMVFGRGQNPINFVSAVDVAHLVRRAIEDPLMRGQILDIAGPENLTIEELIRLVEAASGRTGSVSHVPRLAMRVLSRVIRPINPMRAGQMSAALMMDTDVMTVDGSAIRATQTSIPMTTAADVARRMFSNAEATSVSEGSVKKQQLR
ncbi:MAG: NAD(P)H-binding protein [Chloroflexota bacterium]